MFSLYNGSKQKRQKWQKRLWSLFDLLNVENLLDLCPHHQILVVIKTIPFGLFLTIAMHVRDCIQTANWPITPIFTPATTVLINTVV